MAVYRLELAKSKRALCQNSECKKNGVKIAAGELRWCTLVTIKENQSWQYKHWGCVTPKQIANLKETIEDNLDLLDGYEDLDDESQDKVRKALADGHVDDSDWKGDPEQNRPGKHGFRTPKKKIKPQMADSGNEDDAPTPSKPAPRKRGRAKMEEDEGAANSNELSSKRAKRTSTKGRDSKHDDALDGSEPEIPTTKKGRTKGRKVKAQAKNKPPGMEDESSDHKNVSQFPEQKTCLPQKSAATRGTEADDGDTGVANGDVLSRRRGRKKADSSSKIENKYEDNRPESAREVLKSKRAPKKVEAQESEAAADDEEPESAPKAKKGAKKAATKANTRAKRPSVAEA